MIVIPVVAVAPAPGSTRSSRHRPLGPADTLLELSRLGFSHAHLRIDGTCITDFCQEFPISHGLHLQVGADIQQPDDVDAFLTGGAEYVVVQSHDRDVDRFWALIEPHDHAVIAAVSVCEKRVVCRQPGPCSVMRQPADWIEELARLGIAGVLVDHCDDQGRPGRCDLSFLEDLVETANLPIMAAGVFDRLGDLDALQDRGVFAALLGDGLDTRGIDLAAAAGEFGG
ncbi:MAG: hypothetical protein MNPFHGCM_00097 [Gemmatimonadaceae bacterium]|nr:hypothetical protein [Gemmatimonadaceae bacterium]